MRTAWAFIVKDYLIATSYRTSFLMRLAGIAMAVPIFFFIGRIVPEGTANHFDGSGGNLFAFLISGIGLLGYMTISLTTFNQSLRDSQMMGTLEIVVLSPTSLTALLVYSSLWVYLFTTLRFAIYLALGVAFGMDLGNANPLSALVVLAVSIPGFAAFGMLSASLIVIIKQGNFINLLVSTVSFFLAGVLFPISLLPGWMQTASKFVPLTHALKAMRAALFEGSTVAEVMPQLIILTLLAAVLLPLSLLAFRWSVRRTKVTGTLAQY